MDLIDWWRCAWHWVCWGVFISPMLDANVIWKQKTDTTTLQQSLWDDNVIINKATIVVINMIVICSSQLSGSAFDGVRERSLTGSKK